MNLSENHALYHQFDAFVWKSYVRVNKSRMIQLLCPTQLTGSLYRACSVLSEEACRGLFTQRATVTWMRRHLRTHWKLLHTGYVFFFMQLICTSIIFVNCWLGMSIFTQNTNITLWKCDPFIFRDKVDFSSIFSILIYFNYRVWSRPALYVKCLETTSLWFDAD